jgi:pimeloyl-ACP methyl ester carboxylesterase
LIIDMRGRLDPVYHLIEGQGRPALLMVHGAMCDHHNWDRIVPHLVERFTVVRVDLRGHGQSPGSADDCSMGQWADDINALVERLDLGKVVLVGHSMGARVVAEAAARAPGSVAGVVLVDGSRLPYDETEQASRDLREITSLDLLAGPYANAAMRAEIRAGISRQSRALFAAIADDLQAWDGARAQEVYSGLAAAGVPLLVIQSTYHDRVTPRYSLTRTDERSPYLDYLALRVPHAAIHVVLEAGHFLMMEKPAAVAALIADFACHLRDN